MCVRKRMVSAVMAGVLVLALTACGAEQKAENKTAVNNQAAREDAETAESTEAGIDVDLTGLSSTMVYSEVYNMMMTPSDYVGKIVKMRGITTVFHDDNDGKDYYACVIQDAAACCAQGIEFQLDNEKKYPGEGDEVTVIGEFSTYQIEENEYCTLKGAELV